MRRTVFTILMASFMLSMLLVVQLDERHLNAMAEGIESNLTDDEQPQQNPAIYGDRVVWAENIYESGSWDWEIFLYNLSTNSKIRITYNEFDQFNPKIYGDIIVWEDGRHEPYFDIYMYDLNVDSDYDGVPNYLEVERPHPDPAEIRITDDPVHQERPAIYGTKIVWVDLRYDNRDVFLYDLISGKEAIIAGFNETDDPKYRPSQDNPRIYGDKVVWEDEKFSEGVWEICMYNLSTDTNGDGVPNYLDDDRSDPDPAEERITSSPESDHSPSIYDDKIAFVRSDNIFLYDLKTKTEYTLTESIPGKKIDGKFCSFHGTKVVWAYDVAGLKDIYLYDLTLDSDGDDEPNYRDPDKPSPDPAIVRITNESETISMRPAIYTNKIVWQDNRNLSKPSDSDIYVYTLTANLPPKIMYSVPDFTSEINEMEPLAFAVSTSDPEGDNLTFTWFLNEVQLIEEEGDHYEFIPDYDSAGVHEVKIVVSDGEYPVEWIWLVYVNESVIYPLSITKIDPVINPMIIEGEEITFNIEAVYFGFNDVSTKNVSWTNITPIDDFVAFNNISAETHTLYDIPYGEINSTATYSSRIYYNISNVFKRFNITIEITAGIHSTYYTWVLTILYLDDLDMDGYSNNIEVTWNSDPLDETSTPTDLDKDLIVDAEDDDKDGDGFLDKYDAFPLDPNKQLDGKSDISLEILFIIITLILVIVAIVTLPRILKS